MKLTILSINSAEARLYASLHAPSALDLVRQGRPTVLDPSVVPQGSCDWTDAVDVKSKALQTVLLDIRAAKAELDRQVSTRSEFARPTLTLYHSQDFVLRPWSWNGSQVDFSKWDLGFLGAEANHFVRFRVIFPEGESRRASATDFADPDLPQIILTAHRNVSYRISGH